MPKELILAALAYSLGAATASVVHADPAGADRHQERAIEYYKYGRYRSAALEFERAFREDPQPVRLFSWAQAERQAGNCRKAIQLYREFLAMEPSGRDIEAAELGIAKCRERSDSRRRGQDAPDGEEGAGPGEGAGASTDGPDSPASTDGGDGAQPWHRDTRGVLYTGGGAALLAIGLGTYLSARSLASGAGDQAATHDEFAEVIDAARGRRTFAALFGLGGAALITLAVLRYRTVRAERASVTVEPTAGPETVGLQLSGRF